MTHCLEDKFITAIEISGDQMDMRLQIEGAEPIVAKTDADCCASSWMEHVELPAMGFPVKVLRVDNLDLPLCWDAQGQGVHLKVYGMKITTDKGGIVIGDRNGSNGWYGGDPGWPGWHTLGWSLLLYLLYEPVSKCAAARGLARLSDHRSGATDWVMSTKRRKSPSDRRCRSITRQALMCTYGI